MEEITEKSGLDRSRVPTLPTYSSQSPSLRDIISGGARQLPGECPVIMPITATTVTTIVATKISTPIACTMLSRVISPLSFVDVLVSGLVASFLFLGKKG